MILAKAQPEADPSSGGAKDAKCVGSGVIIAILIWSVSSISFISSVWSVSAI